MPAVVESAEYIENQERPQDKVRDAFAWFDQYGYVVHPKSRRIAVNLTTRISGKSVIEAGCGIGLASAVLSLENRAIATDKASRSVQFARQMYPWLSCAVWDIAATPYLQTAQVVVAIEVIEHVQQYRHAMENLLATATREVWMSTPNRRNEHVDDRRSKNPHHVREFLPEEIVAMATPCYVEAYHWDTFAMVDIATTDVTPLVYRIVKQEEKA